MAMLKLDTPGGSGGGTVGGTSEAAVGSFSLSEAPWSRTAVADRDLPSLGRDLLYWKTCSSGITVGTEEAREQAGECASGALGASLSAAEY